jgi:hypothetical protein
MKRDKRTIDEILRRGLKSASQQEVESSGAEVFDRLRNEFQDAINEFTLVYRPGIDKPVPEPEPELKPLRHNEYALLTAVKLLGEADEDHILEKASELASKELMFGLISLLRLRDAGLVISYPPAPPGEIVVDARYKISPRGERALALGNMAEERVRGHLEDLI